MTVPSQTPEAAGLEDAGHIVWWKAGGVSYYPKGEDFTVSASCRVEPLVTAASAQARIAELEAERDAAQSAIEAWADVCESLEAHLQDRVAMRDEANPERYLNILRSNMARVQKDSEQIRAARWADYRRQEGRATAAEARADRLAEVEGDLNDRAEACLSIVATAGDDPSKARIAGKAQAYFHAAELVRAALQQEG